MLLEKTTRKVVVSHSTYKALEISKLIYDYICGGVSHEVIDSTFHFDERLSSNILVKVSSRILLPQGIRAAQILFGLSQDGRTARFASTGSVLIDVKFLDLEFKLEWADFYATTLQPPTGTRYDKESWRIFKEELPRLVKQDAAC